MARIIILNTCDEWKSYASFQLYGTFAYEDESMSREEQILTFKEDEKRECATTFLRDLQDKLIYGHLELSELR